MRIVRGLNLTPSWKRALGVTNARRKVANYTGVPTTKSGIQRKVGRLLIQAILKGFKS